MIIIHKIIILILIEAFYSILLSNNEKCSLSIKGYTITKVNSNHDLNLVQNNKIHTIFTTKIIII